MNAYLLLPLTACVASAMLTVAVVGRDGGHRANRVAAALSLGATVWSFCEVLWNSAQDPEHVLALVRLSSIGWVAMGPLGLHLFVELVGLPDSPVRRAMPWLYAVSAGFLAVSLGTDWMHTGVLRTSWGWGYEFGPAYPPFWLFTTLCLSGGLALAARHLRSSGPSPAERAQAKWIVVGVMVPLVMASLTDGVLPMLHVQVPRLGTASFTVLGATVLWGFWRYGYTALAPGMLAREILETLHDGVALLRLDGRVRSGNPGLARLLGLELHRLPGLDLGALLRGAGLDPMRPAENLEGELRRVTGEVIPVALSTSLLRDKQGQAFGLVLAVRDLREMAALRSRLVTSGRLAALGELAAGVAHEINNPIAFVRANLGALETLLSKADASVALGAMAEGRELVEESLEGVDRVSSIVRDLLGFAHQGTGRRELVKLDELLDSVLRVATPQLRHAGRVERAYTASLTVRASRQELQQVFLNLVVNAAQAIGEDGQIRLVLLRQGDWAVAEVHDDGPGIPGELVDRIFDPFFTTKPTGEGCGLGLAISHQIVRKHGGELLVRSRAGAGTRFSVRLPAADGAQPCSDGGLASNSTSASQGSSFTSDGARKGS